MLSFQRNLIRPSGLILTVHILSIWIIGFASREIKPSDHGLPYQSSSGAESPEMAAFFNGTSSVVARNPSDPHETGPVELGHVRGERRGHVMEVVLIAGSLVLGVVGITLAIVSAFFYLFQIRRGDKRQTRCALG
ncbi:uncharacterized protein LOC131239509 [Magnolia sinica]|uniref:uncharacterized protein LOC131239509 n=1 Tax=Magnolia sinica TaxID=86752 RepID=UPI00265914AA|nr:uncharacterized protein LOC131239509 [Magnolia sinica]